MQITLVARPTTHIVCRGNEETGPPAQEAQSHSFLAAFLFLFVRSGCANPKKRKKVLLRLLAGC